MIRASGHLVGAGAAGDGEGEDEEREEERDEAAHGEEVGGQEALPVPVGAREPGDGDEEEEPAQDGHGPARLQPRALFAALLGGREPDARDDDGDRAEEGQEVDARRYAVARAPHGSSAGVGVEWSEVVERRLFFLLSEGFYIADCGK